MELGPEAEGGACQTAARDGREQRTKAYSRGSRSRARRRGCLGGRMWPPRRGQGASILCKRKALDSGFAFWQKGGFWGFEAAGRSRVSATGRRRPVAIRLGLHAALETRQEASEALPDTLLPGPGSGPCSARRWRGREGQEGQPSRRREGGGGGGGASRCLQPSNPRPGLAPPAVSPTAANSPRAPPAQGLGSAVLPHRMLCGLEQVTEPLCASVACKLQPQHRVVMKVN